MFQVPGRRAGSLRIGLYTNFLDTTVLAGFVLNRGVFLLFLAEKGMSVTEIALYQALFNITTVVLELPTGLIGDFFGNLDWQLHPNTSHIHPYMYG